MHDMNYFDDLKMNFVIEYETGNNPPIDFNEIDVIGIKNGKMTFIEVKLGNVNQSDITKMKSLSNLYGSRYSDVILAKFGKFNTSISGELVNLDRLKDLKIEVLDGIHEIELNLEKKIKSKKSRI
jgi:hypothetical protein